MCQSSPLFWRTSISEVPLFSALPPVVGRKTFFLPHAALVVEAEAVLALSVLSVLRIAAAYRGGERGKKPEEER